MPLTLVQRVTTWPIFNLASYPMTQNGRYPPQHSLRLSQNMALQNLTFSPHTGMQNAVPTFPGALIPNLWLSMHSLSRGQTTDFTLFLLLV